MTTQQSNCPDCGVKPGELHRLGCDVERCPDCGGQYLMCIGHDEPEYPRIPWSGEWPGNAECREFGWWSRFVLEVGWIRCADDEPGASEDLNRLSHDATWAPEQARWVLRRPTVEVPKMDVDWPDAIERRPYVTPKRTAQTLVDMGAKP
jgi:hypothetical protein